MKALQSYCQQELGSIHSQVFIAQQLQQIEVRLRHPTYQALLSQDVLSSIPLRTMGIYQLGWLDGLAHHNSPEVRHNLLLLHSVVQHASRGWGVTCCRERHC